MSADTVAKFKKIEKRRRFNFIIFYLGFAAI